MVWLTGSTARESSLLPTCSAAEGSRAWLVATSHAREPSASEQVGRRDDSRAVLPVSQTIVPAGHQVELPDMRPQVIRLSPDGKLLVTAGKTHDLVVIDPANGAILQHES